MLRVFPLRVPVRSASSATCESIAALSLPNAKVTAAEQVAPGAFTPPGPTGPAPPFYAKLPSFCRVTATLTPSTDSDMKIEVWLPASAWNGSFRQLATVDGTATSRMRHSPPQFLPVTPPRVLTRGTPAIPRCLRSAILEKLIDFGYRAVHEMTVKAKSIVDAFYGSMPTLSIWNGCSQGGRQGVTAAVRYPTDFDGIVVGAPAVNL